MVQVTLGNFSVQNGRNVLFGLGGSGLDTASLIAALTQARTAPAAVLQQKISKNAQVTAALSEFRQLFNQLQTATDALRNPPGVGNAAENAFAYNSAAISANKSVAGSSYVSVTAAPGTALQSYTITEISSLAAIQKQSTGTFVIADADTTGLVVAAAPASGQFKAGTFTIDSVNGPAIDITLDTSDTLNSIAQKFNNAASATGITATVVQISDGNFKLVFSSLYSGTDYAVDLNDTVTTVDDPDGVLDKIINGTGEFTEIDTTQAAADAVFKLDGNTITRSTNSISDLVTGLTFNLLQKTPTGEAPGDETEITVNISPDTAVARGGIISFINAYNDLRTFAVEQTQLNSDGTYASTAVLANNALFRTTMNTLAAKVSAVVSGIADGDPETLADLGITFTTAPATSSTPEIPNVLTVDEAELLSALQSDFADVRKVFEFTLTSDNTNLRVFSRTNALSVSDFTLTVNPFATQTTSTITVADADTAIVFNSPSSTQIEAGVLTVNGETITLVEGDTLNNIVTKFNAVAADSGLSAAVTGSGGQFQLVFTAEDTATPVNYNLESSAVNPSDIFSNFTFTVAGNYEATYNLGAGNVTIDLDGESISEGAAYRLTGVDGTVLEGLVLIYGSGLATEIDVTATQGVGDLVYNESETLLEFDGTLEIELENIAERDVQLEKDIDRINEQVIKYRDQLLRQFGALEAALSRVNQLLTSLDAQAQARRNASS